MIGLVAMMVFGVTLHITGVGRMSKIGNYVVGLQERFSECPECKGGGKLEVTVEVDSFRDIDCDMCNGTGKLEEDDE